MSSIKCPQCGLVNFTTSIQCKRCQQSLGESSTLPIKRNYQTPTQNFQPNRISSKLVENKSSTMTRQKQSTQMNCIKCGSESNLNLQTFNKFYIPPAVNAAAIAPLLYLILVSIFKVTHKINAPFCQSCWGKFNKGKSAEIIGGGFALVLAVGAIPVFVYFDSIIGFMGCMILAVLSFLVGHIYKEAVSPKIKKVTGEQVVIISPMGEEICYQR